MTYYSLVLSKIAKIETTQITIGNKLGYIHVVEYYAAMKREYVLCAIRKELSGILSAEK